MNDLQCRVGGAPLDLADRRRMQVRQISQIGLRHAAAFNSDLNAARNIMASGTGASVRQGAFALANPVTRETDRKLAA